MQDDEEDPRWEWDAGLEADIEAIVVQSEQNQ